jgi:choline dehydrogenase
MATELYDYVIVGGGSAGSALANRLSADPANRVLVLEAGRPDYIWDVFIHMPAALPFPIGSRFYDWKYESDPEPHMNGRRIYHARGKVLGGSSSINGMIFQRGNPMDYERWGADPGMDTWDFAHCLPYFKRMERCMAADREDEFRGHAGPLVLERGPATSPLFGAFFEAVQQAGYALTDDVNGFRQEGFAPFDRNIRNGRRLSAARAYLHPVMSRANLDVETRAFVTKVLFDGDRAVGVEYKHFRGSVKRASADEVVLCGGAINSPQLLQLSGIGPASLLTSLGITVKHALAGVGEGLQDHYAPRSVARVKNIKTINERARGLNLALEVMKWGATRRGILSLSPTLVYCFWHSGETAESSDLQLTFTPASYKEGEQGKLEDEPGMTVAAWQQRPESRGYVRCRSADPFAAPIIQTNYLAEEIDRRVVVAGMRLARRLLASAPLAPYYEREDFPGPDVQSDDEFLAAATQRAQTTFHPGCSCRMGPSSNPLAVVDDQLRVHGLQGLRVVDASIMPRMISANLNASTLMIADKASDMIRGCAALEATLITATDAPAGRI